MNTQFMLTPDWKQAIQRLEILSSDLEKLRIVLYDTAKHANFEGLEDKQPQSDDCYLKGSPF